MKPLAVRDDENEWYSFCDIMDRELAELDVILMRKDPPFDLNYIYSTYLLEAAHEKGTLVVNNPQSLRDCKEKVFATQFPLSSPPVLIASAEQKLWEFQQKSHENRKTCSRISRMPMLTLLTEKYLCTKFF